MRGPVSAPQRIPCLCILVALYLSVSGCSYAPAPAQAAAAPTPAPSAAEPIRQQLSTPGDRVTEQVSFPTPTPTPVPTRPAVETPSAPERLEAVSKQRAPEPTRGAARGSVVALPKSIKFPSVGVETEIEQVGATPKGGMDVPTNPARAGWYRYGPRPGDAGNAAIAGHVDWGGKVMPFWYLNRLKIGDPVEVLAADGSALKFEVQWSRWYDKDAPTGEIFGSSEIPEITLVTCGGYFDPRTKEYASRLVVRAAMKKGEG